MKKDMKKALLSWLLVFSLILPTLSSVIYTQAADDESGLKDYDSMTMEEILASEESLTWVITGDSITHNATWSAGVNSYGEWLEQYLYEIGRDDDSLVLSGWGGADILDFQTSEIEAVIKAEGLGSQGSLADPGMGLENFITKYNPDVITIKLGMNNRYDTTATFTKYYKQMLDDIYAICAEEYQKIPKIILLAPTPLQSENIYDDTYHVENDDAIEESTLRIRNAVEAIAEEYDLLFCDLRTAFMDAQVELGEDYAATFFRDPSDGLHPNEAGQYCMFKALSKTLGIYDETMLIYQCTYDDLDYHALYADSTDGVTYANSYDNSDTVDDEAEMNRTMPALTDTTAISSVEFSAETGDLVYNNTDLNASTVDLTKESEGVDTLTVSEVQEMEKEYTIVFRAKLNAYSTRANQPIFYLSTNQGSSFNDTSCNVFMMGVPGTTNLWYRVRNGASSKCTLDGATITFGDLRTAMNDGNWHTVAIVQSSSGLTYYVDGIAYSVLTSGESAITLSESIGSLFTDVTDETFDAAIGRYGESTADKNWKTQGKFDFWQLYSEALTADQVASLYIDYGTTTDTASWTDTVAVNNTWAVFGGSQMAGYETNVVNRSLMRYLENAMRASSGKTSYRDIHMYNMATPGYDVADMVEEYDTIVGNRSYQVFLLYPELTDVYESDYVHSDEKVAAYKENVKTLINKNSSKVVVLWTPVASNDETINSYIDDYANAVREISGSDTTILFFDANRFMNENMEANSSLVNNWFEDGAYISPLCAVDIARAFYVTTALDVEDVNDLGLSELIDHNLRYTSDAKVFKGNFVNDYIAADVSVDEETNVVTVDVSAIKEAYPDVNLNIVVLPYKGAGNYNEDNINLSEVATVSVDGNVCTFAAPCADLNLAIYGENTTTGVIYRYKDISLNIDTDATIPEVVEELTEVCLDSLEVMSAPEIAFDKNTTEYSVELYSYQTYARVKATAKAGITITINDEVVASGAISNIIKVDDGDTITVTASGEIAGQTVTKTYTLNLVKEEYPDIIITEVMQDGYLGYELSGNDNYELVEIYNSSGHDLNLLDYSIGYKKDYTYNAVTVANGGEYPYYFTGNDQAFSNGATHTGIKEITKYSMYWEDKVDKEPDKIIFPADSTMVIWIKYSPSSDEATRKTYGSTLTYDTLIQALEKHAGTATLTTDIDGTETAVVPKESQLVVAEYYTDAAQAGLQTRAGYVATERNWYIDNFATDDTTTNKPTRGWLFILKDDATQATNGTITAEGNNIISAAKFIRPGSTDKLSSVFSYDTTRGMSLVKNEGTINYNLIGTGNTSDVMGYSNLTSFGAIEYWQKPADFGDETAPTYTNNTLNEVASGAEGTISIDLADDTDIRYVQVYVRKLGEDTFTKIATKDLVLEAGVLKAGVSADITSYTYTCSVGEVTGTVEYYVTVEDGNGNVATIGTEEEPCTMKLVPKVVEEYSVEDASAYVKQEAPTCSQEGYLFSGWYADEACVAEPLQSLEGVSGTVYALFVTEEVLSVKAQISSNLGDTDNTNDTAGSIRFVTTVDSLNYLQVGFDIAYDKDGDGTNETTKNSASNKVYKLLYAVNATSGDTMEYYPTVFSDVSVYFKACTVNNVPAAKYGMDFTVTPYWITPDGIKVEGVTAEKSINDGIYGNAEAEIDGTYYNELEQAIEAANADADATTIIVLNDAEVESQMSITTDITIQSKEREDITIYRGSGLETSDMFAVSSGATLTIEDSDEKGAFVLDGRTYAEAQAGTERDSAAGSTGSLISNFGTLNIDNVTVQYVRKTSGTGGVINNNSDNSTNANATVTITNSVFDNNYSASYGSVVYSRAKLIIEDSEFANNAASANGGVLCNHGGSLFEINRSYFANNGTMGEGAVIWNNTVATITESTFTDNIAYTNGGAIRSTAGTMKVEDCVFTSNTAVTNKGGAIYLDKTTIDIIDTKFVGNSAAVNGGAVGVAGSSNATFTGTSEMALLESNSVTGTSGVGGAIYFGSGSLTVSGYTFNNNSATTTGGAMQVQADMTMSDCTFTSNSSSGHGGAIYTKANMTISDCTFTSNISSGNRGGAIYTGSSKTLTMKATDPSKAVFKGNKALQGGAICVGTGTINVTGYTFEANSATEYAGGGAIKLNNDNITANLTECVFIKNEAQKGGAISADASIGSDGTGTATNVLTITDCSFGGTAANGTSLGNIANDKATYTNYGGGAIWANDRVTINLIATEGTTKAFFENNTSNVCGGAIYLNGATLTGSGYTFTNNWNNSTDISEDIYNVNGTITYTGDYTVAVPTTEE